jgi:two-component system chemotaxis response regulator CheY
MKDFEMGPKTLLADDSGVMRKIILRALNALEINDVTEAVDGAEALEFFKEEKFDLVLSDWNMPNMTGLELCAAIRETGSTVPIFMITTEAETSRVLEAIQAGASDYLVKPFEQDVLLDKLQKYVSVKA